MKAALQLFHSAVKTGAEVLLLVERLDDPEEAERRHAICRSNSGECYDENSDRCKECSCFMAVKTAMLKHRNPHAALRTEVTHCPLSKWGGEEELEIVNHYRQLDGKEPLILNQ